MSRFHDGSDEGTGFFREGRWVPFALMIGGLLLAGAAVLIVWSG